MTAGDNSAYQIEELQQGGATLRLTGNWQEGQTDARFADLREQLTTVSPSHITIDATALGDWDSLLMAFLLQLRQFCENAGIGVDTHGLPDGAQRLLQVASAVSNTAEAGGQQKSGGRFGFHPLAWFERGAKASAELLEFIGELSIALVRALSGQANLRREDILHFIYLAGPNAFSIITLTSILVGMILAYLGAVQLAQFGAEIYVADLVAIGMLREMGALMTAIVMAGRTGAAYAAQLGTMQTNEEIDAITTLGISPMEFLVLPRFIALVLIMPLLTIYANVLGIFGGGLVAVSMDISFVQYVTEIQAAMTLTQVGVGLSKSVVFGALIAMAGCRAGIQSGRSSAAVGQAATTAVVTAMVYLIVADAAFNILFQQLGI